MGINISRGGNIARRAGERAFHAGERTFHAGERLAHLGKQAGISAANKTRPVVHGARDAARSAGRTAARGMNFAKNAAARGMNSAGSASGVNVKDIKEGIQDARDMAGGPMSAKAYKGAARVGKKVLKHGTSTALTAFGVPKGVSDKAFDLVTSKKFWQRIGIGVGIIIVAIILLFTMFDVSSFDVPPTNFGNGPTTSDTCTPSQFSQQAFGKTSVCTITVSYTGSAQDIIITDTILPGTEYVCSTTGNTTCTSKKSVGIFDKASNTVTFYAQQLGLQLNPVNITINVTIRITSKQNNVKVWNAYSINPVGLSGGSSGGTSGGTIPPGGNYNLRTWAIALLQGLGIPHNSGQGQDVIAIMHWEQEEGGNWHNSAKYNPLNTTQDMPGSTTFMSSGVGAAPIRIYISWQQGLEATVKTLKNGSYGPILAALKNGSYSEVGQAVVASPWGTRIW